MKVSCFALVDPFSTLGHQLSRIVDLGFKYADVTDNHPGGLLGCEFGFSATASLDDNPGDLKALFGKHGLEATSVCAHANGANIAQGILAALVRKGISGSGSLVETSLLESMVDFQFEVLATHMNSGGRPPQRSRFRSAHSGLSAPYGVYPTKDGFIAIAMTPLDRLEELLNIPELRPYSKDPGTWFSERDAIKQVIARRLAEEDTQTWLDILISQDVWCADVMSWDDFLTSEAFLSLGMVQQLKSANDKPIRLVGSPLKINGYRGACHSVGPELGFHSESLRKEFGLGE